MLTEIANHGAFISAFFHVKFPFMRLVLAGLCILPYEPSLRDPVLVMWVWRAKPLLCSLLGYEDPRPLIIAKIEHLCYNVPNCINL